MLLGVIHRAVGIAEQALRGVLIASGQDDAQARRYRELVAGDEKRSLERLDDPVADDRGFGLAGDVLAEDDELIASQPGDRVLLAHAVSDARGERLEQLVAGGVAEAVVYPLEAVDVEKEQRGGTWETIRALKGVGEPVEEQDSVGKPGERVMKRLVAQAPLQLIALGYVVDHLRDASQLPIRAIHRRGEDLGEKARSVVAHAPAPSLAAAFPDRDVALAVSLAGVTLLWGQETRVVLAQHLVLAVDE